MLGFHLTDIFENLRALGVVRSKRHFSRAYLGHGAHYLRDVQQRSRGEFRVPLATVERLRQRLRALVPLLSKGTGAEIEQIVRQVDQQTAIADWLSR